MPTTTLPVAFILTAEAALSAGGSDPGGVDQRFDRIARLIQPVLTTANLLERDIDLASVALDYADAQQNQPPVDDIDAQLKADVSAIKFSYLEDGLEVGLVAGYCLAVMCGAAACLPTMGGAR